MDVETMSCAYWDNINRYNKSSSILTYSSNPLDGRGVQRITDNELIVI